MKRFSWENEYCGPRRADKTEVPGCYVVEPPQLLPAPAVHPKQ